MRASGRGSRGDLRKRLSCLRRVFDREGDRSSGRLGHLSEDDRHPLDELFVRKLLRVVQPELLRFGTALHVRVEFSH